MKNFDLSVYFVVDPQACSGRCPVEVTRLALEGGATLIQLRDKENSLHDVQVSAETLLELCRVFDVPFLINDYVEIARNIGADGVHIGQGDMSAADARKALGADVIIGLTAFTEDHCQAVDADIVDYLGTGPFFPTKTDKGKPILGAQGFAALAGMAPVPVVGIGGITAENAHEVINSGANGVAMMRAISAADDPKKATQDIADAVHHARLKEAS